MAIDHNRRASRPATPSPSYPLILLAILAVAFLMRTVVAVRAGVQIDEARLLYAVETVASKGLPKFDSSVLYLVGTPTAYLFSPLAWMFDGMDLLDAVRIGNAVLSTIAVAMVWKLTDELVGNPLLTVGVTFCAALDPMSLYWGTIASANASIAFCAIFIVYAGYRIVTIPDESILRRTDLSNPVIWLVFWLTIGSLTYYAVWLFVPAIILAAIVRWGRRVFRARHPLRIGLELAIVAPIMVWMFGSMVGPGSGSSFNPGPPSFGQLWNNLDRLLDVDFNLDLWRAMYYGSKFAQWVPFFVLLATGALIAWYVLRGRELPRSPIATPVLVLLLGSYWLPVLIIANGSFVGLLTGVLPFGYLIIGICLWLYVPRWQLQVSRWSLRTTAGTALSLVVVLTILFSLIGGSRWQLDYRSPDPDYFAVTEYVETVRANDQLVLTPYPAVAEMVFASDNEWAIVPLAGKRGSSRFGSETRDKSTRDTPDYFEDYWTGRPAIGTSGQLCQYLLYVSPAPLIIIDTARLEAEWGFRGEFEVAIEHGTQVLAEGENGIQIRQPIPLEQWSAEGQQACGVQPAQQG